MPFTFAHPSVCLPLKRSLPALRLSALTVGSMVPDFGYYFPLSGYFEVSAHTFIRSFTFCLPVGLTLFAIFYFTRIGWARLFPVPISSALLERARSLRLNRFDFVLIPLSLLLGSWSHIVWDSFTHKGGWFVERAPYLQQEVAFGWLRVYHVLQHISTIAGLAAIALYIRMRSPDVNWKRVLTDRRVVFLIAALAIPPIFEIAFTDFAAIKDITAYRLRSFELIVNSLRTTLVILTAAAIYLTSTNTDGKPQPS